MKYKNIIWDWNGTIVDDAYLFVDIMNKTLEKHNLPIINLKKYRSSFCFPIQKYWKKLGFVFDKNSFNALNEQFIFDYSQKMFEPNLQKHIVDLLKIIKKNRLKQFVLSASEQNLLNKSIEYYSLSEYFDSVVGVNNLNALGKEKMGLELILKNNLVKKETLIIGDTEYDLNVSKAIGSDCLLLSAGHFSKDRLKKLNAPVVDCVDEITLFLF